MPLAMTSHTLLFMSMSFFMALSALFVYSFIKSLG
jgi:hypothetical protein